jgi:hypothetical protein
MRIYNYLFFKGHQLAVLSKNFDDLPIFGAMVYVVPCVMFNIFTVFLLLEGFEVARIPPKNEYRFVFAILLFSLIYLYYWFGGRYKRIILHYEQIEKKNEGGWHPLIVIILFCGTSFMIGFLAALFKNGDWIFSK